MMFQFKSRRLRKLVDKVFGRPPALTVTEEDLRELAARVKTFNAGAIDERLSYHVDAVFAAWRRDLLSREG